MEIMLNDLLRDVEFLDIDENAKIDSEKNFIIFGSNGLGKTTIYKNLKNKYPDFDYLDYEETKDLFKKNKSKIEISLGINKLEDLLAQKEQIEKDLSIQTFLKPKHITSKKAAKDISVELEKKYAAKEISKIDLEVNEFKEKDGYLYAIYGTPAESLCGLQVEQFRKMYGIVKGVSDRPYVSNSFHCHVTEDVTPIEKQDLEGRFWELCNGGKIQYVRYPIGYNKEAIRTLIRRAMNLGYYEGVNLSLAYCDDCGHQELEMDVCPVCGSHNLTKIDRMNGYLSYSRVHGDTRLNEAKMAEIAERKSM